MSGGYTCLDSKPYDGEAYTTEEGDLTVAERCKMIIDDMQVVMILLRQMQEATSEKQHRSDRVSDQLQGS